MNVSDEDRLSALTSLYSTERADLTSIGNQSLGMVGLVLTYIVAIVFGLAQSADKENVSIFWLAAPIPLLVFLAFYEMFISLSRARTKSCKILEDKITSEIGPKINLDEQIGVAVSDRVMDINAATDPLRKIVIFIAYAPLLLAIPSLTLFILIRAIRHHTPLWIVIISIILYAILLIPSGIAWIKELGITFRHGRTA
jgi:hypothetical protein